MRQNHLECRVDPGARHNRGPEPGFAKRLDPLDSCRQLRRRDGALVREHLQASRIFQSYLTLLTTLSYRSVAARAQ